MENSNMAEPAASGALGFAIWKFGAVKVFGLGAALIGAGIMAIFRPPKSRKEMFMQAGVALASSLLFGGSAVHMLAGFDIFGINLATSLMTDVIQFNAMVHGLIGAMAWGVFGGLAVLRDKFSSDPIQAVRDIKSL
jgi:hypothetical protein